MKWKITTLIENHPDSNEKYRYEHGFSVLIEGSEEQKVKVKILMDTGKSGAFYDNARDMGEKLTDLDAVCISHGHYDHAGGFMRLLEETKTQKQIYVGRGFFEKKYCEKRAGDIYYNGIPFEKEQFDSYHIPLEEIDADEKRIGNGITIHRNFIHEAPYEKWNLIFYLKQGEEYVQDHFGDEIVLALDVKEGLFVITGCSHPGIVNILETIRRRTGKKICGVIGGTHLMDADKDRLQKTMEDFQRLGIEKIGVSHCTGDDHLGDIQTFFNDKFIFNCTGNVIYLD